MIDKQKVLDEIIRFSTEEGAGAVCSQLYANIHSMPEEQCDGCPYRAHWLTAEINSNRRNGGATA